MDVFQSYTGNDLVYCFFGIFLKLVEFLEVILNWGIANMNMVDLFGIYVWSILCISDNKKLDKFYEVKKKHTPPPPPPQYFNIWNMAVLYT